MEQERALEVLVALVVAGLLREVVGPVAADLVAGLGLVDSAAAVDLRGLSRQYRAAIVSTSLL